MMKQRAYERVALEPLMKNSMNKIIIEVGSTVTKVDKNDGTKIERIKEVTIFFKKHYKEDKKLREEDLENLVQIVNELQKEYQSIYICGTSIFRELEEKERADFLRNFQKETGLEFHIISQEQEGNFTVLGATRKVKEKVCVFIGGGGSTEIAIYHNGIKEKVNSNIGVMDVLEVFPDLNDDIAMTSLDEVKKYIKERLSLPKEKADILILAGGAHEKFARLSGIFYEENKCFEDNLAPIMMDIDSRTKETIRYFQEISLDEIKSRVEDPNWWNATRAMCAFVLVVAEEIGAKYIIPTNIGMVYGILEEE